jgi:adenosyl cobinamide kinase/adenosyl cobinamide phosphate guanylyltransferase
MERTRTANAERQARYRERQKEKQNSLSDAIQQSVLPTVVVPQQVTNSIMSPLVTLGDSVNRSVGRTFEGYDLGVSSICLAGLGVYGGYRFVREVVENPNMKDYLLGMGFGGFIGIVGDVALNRLMGKISPPVPINTTVSLVSDSEIASNRMFRPVTGAEMQGMAFAGIQLRGEFADIIGHTIPLHSSIQTVGGSGDGKSHFLTKIASSFGSQRTLYVSTEEGLSDKVKERFRRYNADSVPFVTAFTRDDLISLVQEYQPRILVVDSISNLSLSNTDARQLAKWLASRVDLLLYSLHATKTGDFQGSMSLLHDATVQIELEKGIATVNKNRCGESGKSLNLFPSNSSQILPLTSVKTVQEKFSTG